MASAEALHAIRTSSSTLIKQSSSNSDSDNTTTGRPTSTTTSATTAGTTAGTSTATTRLISTEEETLIDNKSQVAYTGEDIETIPDHLWKRHSDTARRLDLSFNRLSSLTGLENFKVLEELILDNNELSDSALALPPLPHLHTLTLNKNQVIDIDGLLATIEKQCPNLKYLSLLGNKACPHEILQSGHDDQDYQRYRYYVIYRLSQLTFLDSSTITSEERREAKRVGAFMKVVRPVEITEKKKKFNNSEEIPKGYNPLPAAREVAGQHKGVFGQCKYVYHGKHSEGNRFIRNNQL